MTRSEYRRYIASEHWLQRRKQFLFYHPECNRCGLSGENAREAYDQGLHVHHRNYQRVGCELDSDLEALCRRCHEIESCGKTNLSPGHLCGSDLILYRSLIGGTDDCETYMTEHGLAGLFGERP